MTEATAASAPSDDAKEALAAIVKQLTRLADAQFSTKNAIVANTAVLQKLVDFQLAGGTPEGAVTLLGSGAASAPAKAAETAAAASDTASAVIATGQLSLAVGPTRAIKEPADALQYLAAGAVLTLDDAVYLKPFHNTVPNLAIVSASGMPRLCYFDGQHGHGGGHDMAYHKGMIHSALPIVVRRLGFVRCGSTMSTDNYSNEAAIWLGDYTGTQPWTATVEECTFDDCANAIFTADDPLLTLVQKGSVFGFVAPNAMNAAAAALGSHAAHDIYSQAGKNEITGSYFYGSPGHAVKTRSEAAHIADNPVMCSDGGRVVDAAEGGFVTFTGNQVWTRTDRQGQAVGQNTGAFGNANVIGYALESARQGTPGMVMSGNVFNVSRSNATIAAGNGATIASASDAVTAFGSGSIALQGSVTGLPSPTVGGAVPPPIPQPPAWAIPPAA